MSAEDLFCGEPASKPAPPVGTSAMLMLMLLKCKTPRGRMPPCPCAMHAAAAHFCLFKKVFFKNDGTNHIFGLVLTITMILLAAHYSHSHDLSHGSQPTTTSTRTRSEAGPRTTEPSNHHERTENHSHSQAFYKHSPYRGA